jgi:hypothetical protein
MKCHHPNRQWLESRAYSARWSRSGNKNAQSVSTPRADPQILPGLLLLSNFALATQFVPVEFTIV